MATLEQEVEGIAVGLLDLSFGMGGSPPCELNVRGEDRKCGKPSVVRVIITCNCVSEPMFLCAKCFDDVVLGNTSCTTCGCKHLEWRMA